MSLAPDWANVLAAVESAREELRTASPPLTSLRRLARMIEQRAALQGHLLLSAAAGTFLGSPPESAFLEAERMLRPLRELVFRCLHRQGFLCIISSEDLFTTLYNELLGLEQRVVHTSHDGFLDILDEKPIAGLVLVIHSEEDLDFLARLRLDPRCAWMPILCLLPEPNRRYRTECTALGAASTLNLPSDGNVVSLSIACLLGQDHPVLRRLSQNTLPKRRAFTRLASSIQESARAEGSTYCLLLAHPLNLHNARALHGADFNDQLLEAGAKMLRAHVGSMARIHALDRDTLVWISRAQRSSLFRHLDQLTTGSPVPIPTPDGKAWFNRLAIGGVEVADTTLERALLGARRMLALAVQAGGSAPVLTTLEERGTPRHRALLFEPDPVVAEVLVRELKHAGVEVTRPTEPVEALAFVRGSRFDLVLTAVDGPAGIRVVKGMRSVLADGSLLAITSNVGTARSALQYDADDIITKPIDAPIFVARLRARLRKRS